ncbi:LysR family transcriptional regulator [Streptomyces sp. NPDC057950]|uniref:LysR family transcriptional regulator n=1 Tax=Streptomyces sp. NPDC057950 TaxID=3346288 RepID=UPI0036E61F89
MCEIAERGSFTAAAELGYTQSAVSRQVAVLERAAGVTLSDRRPGGVTLTAPGLTLLRHAVVALGALAAAERELKGLAPERGVVRFGTFPSAGALILPRTLAALRRTQPGICVTTREAATPALVRALQADGASCSSVAASALRTAGARRTRLMARAATRWGPLLTQGASAVRSRHRPARGAARGRRAVAPSSGCPVQRGALTRPVSRCR